MSEDISGVFKPDAKTIMKIFGDADSYYQIPDYQRPYSWNSEQIEQLWDDLYTAMDSGDESYFLGPMILIKSQNGYFDVVDGQQRLTTLTILFCVLRDLYLKKDNRIQNAIKSLVDQKYRLRLITQLNYQNQFENEILDSVKFPVPKETKKKREESNFINAAVIFKEKIDSIKDPETINKFVEYLLNRVILITVVCSNQSFAIKLFQILNTRGLELSNADLIKSYLYGNCDSTRRGQFISTWKEMEIISEQVDESLSELFTYYEYYLSAANPKQSLYDELTKRFKGQEPNNIAYNAKKYFEYFNEINEINSKIIFSFKYLPNKVFWKSILTTAKNDGFGEFDGLCYELRRLYYLYWIAGYTTSKTKLLSFNIIEWVKNKKNLVEIKNEIDKKIKEDNVIRGVQEALADDAYGKAWLRPLLALIEYEQTDDAKLIYIELNSKLDVDHILPEKWYLVDEWKKDWSETDAKTWSSKIGNLTLLSGTKNRAAQNCKFSEKKEIYKNGHGKMTAFEISKKVIETASWLKTNVEERNKWMLGQIEQIFSININQ